MGATDLIIEQPAPWRTAWKKVAPVLSFAFAAFCLWLVAREVDLDRLWGQVRGCHPGWMALAVACDVLGYVTQGLRWRLLLRSVGDLPLLGAVKAVYAGLFASEILPFRPGEVLRGWLVARELSIRPVAVVPSMVVERLIDAVWLALGLLLLARSVPLPPTLSHAADVFTAAVGCVSVAVVVLRPGFARFGLLRDLRLAPVTLPLMGAWAGSAVMLAFQALSFWAAMRACRIGLSLPEAFGVLLVVRIGTLLPGAPANLGTYQFAATLGLLLFGVPRDVAAPFSMILFAVLTVPLWVLGAAAVARTGVGLAGLRSRLSRCEDGG